MDAAERREMLARLDRARAAKKARAASVWTPTGPAADPWLDRSQWSDEGWARWRAGRWGTIPRWEWRSGPGRAVERLIVEPGVRGGWSRRRTAEHVQAVWGSCWNGLARMQRVDPFEFGARVGRHWVSCGLCSEDEFAQQVWVVCLRKTGLLDVIRAIAAGGELPPAAGMSEG